MSVSSRNLVALVALSVVALALIGQEANAAPPGYTRSAGIGVNHGGTATLTDYQVRLTINTMELITSGQMQPDADDMVFTLGQCDGAVLPHFIESGVNTATTVVWVKVPSLPVGMTPLLMWHGNPTATATSAARGVFIGTGVANDPISSTNQVVVAMTNTADQTQRGFRFTANVPALVVEFGKREPTGTNRFVTLFNFTTQAIVRQVTVTGAAGTYGYTSTAPFWLTAGQQYTIQVYGNTGDSYYYGTSSQLSADLTYGDLRYCNGCTQNTFPTDALAGYHYGQPDFRYYKRLTTTPEPTQVAVTAACTESATCDTDCTAPLCGDGVLNTSATETCDDGNTIDTDACRASCAAARCGDGVVHTGVEACDDGNANDTDTCRNNCMVAAAPCGDGVVQTGEACDDGNTVETDACRNNCAAAACGDGVVEEGVELCDDGNALADDGCDPDCTMHFIADGCCSTDRSPRAPLVSALLALLVAFAVTRRRRSRSP